MTPSLALSQYEAAIDALEDGACAPEDKAEMLMEIAMGLQLKPKSAQELELAVELYRRALALCPAPATLLRARATARLGTALQALPAGGDAALEQARDCHEQALAALRAEGTAEEAAEAEMNLGLVLQSLAGSGRARLNDAIHAYHRALRTFVRESHPREFAILHNNLAVAYLSIPLSDERGKMREALAVQSFEEVLTVITLVDHPGEYAMIQNNLGNALQYASSGHALQNNLRALEAYDEALKVRTRRNTPVEYANTLANKANVLRNLPGLPVQTGEPGQPGQPGLGREACLGQACELYREAAEVYAGQGETGHRQVVLEALAECEADLQALLATGGAANQHASAADAHASHANGHGGLAREPGAPHGFANGGHS